MFVLHLVCVEEKCLVYYLQMECVRVHMGPSEKKGKIIRLRMDQQPTPNMNRENFNKYSLDVQREIPSAGNCVARFWTGTRKSRRPMLVRLRGRRRSIDRNDAEFAQRVHAHRS